MTDWGPNNHSFMAVPWDICGSTSMTHDKRSIVTLRWKRRILPDKEPWPNSIGLIEYGDAYKTGYIIRDSLEFVAK